MNHNKNPSIKSDSSGRNQSGQPAAIKRKKKKNLNWDILLGIRMKQAGNVGRFTRLSSDRCFSQWEGQVRTGHNVDT